LWNNHFYQGGAMLRKYNKILFQVLRERKKKKKKKKLKKKGKKKKKKKKKKKL